MDKDDFVVSFVPFHGYFSHVLNYQFNSMCVTHDKMLSSKSSEHPECLLLNILHITYISPVFIISIPGRGFDCYDLTDFIMQEWSQTDFLKKGTGLLISFGSVF